MSCLFGVLILKWWYSVRDLFIAIVMLTFLLHCTLAALPNKGDYGRRCKFLRPLLKKNIIPWKLHLLKQCACRLITTKVLLLALKKKIFLTATWLIYSQLWPTVEEADSLAHVNDSLPLILLFDPMVTRSIVTRLG